jgi:hypothetical protein
MKATVEAWTFDLGFGGPPEPALVVNALESKLFNEHQRIRNERDAFALTYATKTAASDLEFPPMFGQNPTVTPVKWPSDLSFTNILGALAGRLGKVSTRAMLVGVSVQLIALQDTEGK